MARVTIGTIITIFIIEINLSFSLSLSLSLLDWKKRNVRECASVSEILEHAF